MDQRAIQEVSLLLNAFPQARDTDPKGLLYAFQIALEGVSTQAITDMARRYIAGAVEGQSTDYAPSPAAFAKEARKRHELLEIKARPRLEAPQREEPYSPPVAPEKVLAWRDALAGRRTLESVIEQYQIKTAQ